MLGKDSLLLRRASLFFLLTLLVFPFPVTQSKCQKYPRIFNFGDSNSDTGGLVAGLGFPVNLPNGRSFFRRSTGRLCDGRLVLDFLCESLNTNYLSPYLDSLGSNFSNGVNFAVIGSSTQPTFVPFNLNVQVLQFLHFKARTLEIFKGSRHLIDYDGFHNALYVFDIGQNDLSNAFSAHLSYTQVAERIPSMLGEIKDAVKTIYKEGGRSFWIHNTGPLGCLPQKLSLFNKDNRDLDSNGCLQTFNDAAKSFNGGLRALCEEMRSELKNATIVYVDIYAIKYDLFANSTKYGFRNPLVSCCGIGGPPYNYNINVTCGQTGYQVCSDGSRYVSWDGVHYSEAANAVIASKILSMQYSEPRYKFDYFCHT
ncbi:GDSL esterase/lipase At1g09390 [Magnolia sinica]|uniref:GDSL esterase/lipase At1g09390 n=1 Tax=Magnolia sinica TaxID=86752 RepID=UPI00265A94C3|nr:GDSL esterase/lipase At1g09390 [Magnolia sinica]